MIAMTRALRESFRRALAVPRRRAMNARVLFELDALNARLDDIVGLLSPVQDFDHVHVSFDVPDKIPAPKIVYRRCAGCDSLLPPGASVEDCGLC